jgi:hypothetical protein
MRNLHSIIAIRLTEPLAVKHIFFEYTPAIIKTAVDTSPHFQHFLCHLAAENMIREGLRVGAVQTDRFLTLLLANTFQRKK